MRLEEAFKREGAKASFEQVESEWRTLGDPCSPRDRIKRIPCMLLLRLMMAGEVQYISDG